MKVNSDETGSDSSDANSVENTPETQCTCRLPSSSSSSSADTEGSCSNDDENSIIHKNEFLAEYAKLFPETKLAETSSGQAQGRSTSPDISIYKNQFLTSEYLAHFQSLRSKETSSDFGTDANSNPEGQRTSPLSPNSSNVGMKQDNCSDGDEDSTSGHTDLLFSYVKLFTEIEPLETDRQSDANENIPEAESTSSEISIGTSDVSKYAEVFPEIKLIETLADSDSDANAPESLLTTDETGIQKTGSFSSECSVVHSSDENTSDSNTNLPEGLSSSTNSSIATILFSKPQEPDLRQIEDKIDLALLQSVYRDSEFQRVRSDFLLTATDSYLKLAKREEYPPMTPTSSMESIPELDQRKWYQLTGRRATLERFSLRNVEMFDTMGKGPDENLAFYEITTKDGRSLSELRLHEIWDNLKAFVNTPVAIGFELNCRILRERRGLGLFPRYFLNLEVGCKNILLLTARRRKKSLRTNYLISTDPSDLLRRGVTHVATVKSNLFGTKFTVSDGRSVMEKKFDGFNYVLCYREELTSIVYEDDQEWKSGAGPGPRNMRIFLPALVNESQRLKIRPTGSYETIMNQGKQHVNNGILELQNKSAAWDAEKDAYTLAFKGQVTCQPSKVNFQIVHKENEEELICQFGKVDKDVFSLHIRYPLCPLQAFSIALSSLSTLKNLCLHNELVVCKRSD